ncbi:MAG: YitT family protein [Marinifilaceae bacterium]
MKKYLGELKAYGIMSFGIILYTFAVTAFFIPHEVVTGGVTGMGTLIYFLSGETIPVGYSYFAINSVLIAISLKVLGGNFGVKTIYAMCLGSGLLVLFQKYLASAFLYLFNSEIIVNDPFLACILGGMICGVGIGMALSQGGSTGGTDIIAMMVNKYRNISPGKVILYLDVFIIATGFLVDDPQIEKIILGYVVMGVVAYSIDMFIEGKKQSCQLMIFSKKYDQVADAILANVNRGVSVIDAQGWYTKQEGKMVMVVIRKHETQKIFKLVKEIDKKAFISMGTVMGVYGEGFEDIRA